MAREPILQLELCTKEAKNRKVYMKKNLESIEAIIGASISVLVITCFIFEISISSKSLQNL